MKRPLRLLADDLTGALDSAAAFGSSATPLPVVWRVDAVADGGALAVDTGTRERPAAEAAAVVSRLAPRLFAGSEGLAYKKIDSLLRGSEAEEIDAVLRARPFTRCLVAPAFPAQARTTRGGRQGLVSADGGWRPIAVDLAARLEALGHAVARRRPGEPVPAGVSLFDAEDDGDLDAVAAAGQGDDVLWVGSGGLAAALARRQAAAGTGAPPRLAGPILGLFGTDHPVMLDQLAAAPAARLSIRTGEDAAPVARRLGGEGAALVTVELPPGTPRAAAAMQIGQAFDALVRRLDPPGTLLVAGGETLRALCNALGAEGLAVTGELMPGIPCSILSGGPWSGTVTVSKSGAFGAPDLLATLLAAHAAPRLGDRLP